LNTEKNILDNIPEYLSTFSDDNRSMYQTVDMRRQREDRRRAGSECEKKDRDDSCNDYNQMLLKNLEKKAQR
jgi:hypothetical protein